MRQRHAPLVQMGGQIEITGDLRLELIQATDQALRIMGLIARQGIVGLAQGARRVDFRAVDGISDQRCACCGDL